MDIISTPLQWKFEQAIPTNVYAQGKMLGRQKVDMPQYSQYDSETLDVDRIATYCNVPYIDKAIARSLIL